MPHLVTSPDCYTFITHMSNCVMGATPMVCICLCEGRLSDGHLGWILAVSGLV